MRFVRGSSVLVLVVLLLGLTPLAYADPPDPTWIGGFWDDDDFVAFIASTSAVAELHTVGAGPQWAPIARVELCEPNTAPATLRSVVSSRAPPVALTSC